MGTFQKMGGPITIGAKGHFALKKQEWPEISV